MKVSTNRSNLIYYVILAIVTMVIISILTIAYYRSKNVIDNQPAPDFPPQPIVRLVDINNTTTDVEKLPENLPNDLPVEYETINYSQNTSFDAGVTEESNYSYQSQDSLADIYQQYVAYFEANEYRIAPSGGDSLTMVTINAQQPDRYGLVVIADKTDYRDVQVTVKNK